MSAIRPNNSSKDNINQAMLNSEEKNLIDIVDWALDNGDRDMFIKYSEKLNKFREMMGE